jgi:hypothetical protein
MATATTVFFVCENEISISEAFLFFIYTSGLPLSIFLKEISVIETFFLLLIDFQTPSLPQIIPAKWWDKFFLTYSSLFRFEKKLFSGMPYLLQVLKIFLLLQYLCQFSYLPTEKTYTCFRQVHV